MKRWVKTKMSEWQSTLLKPGMTILQAVEIINANALQIGVVVNESNVLLGTITDGDVRRAILRKIDLSQPAASIMNTHPLVAPLGYGRDQLLDIMKQKRLRQVPIVDNEQRVVGLVTIDDLLQADVYDNWVVIMAGGLGSRLGELTKNCPKPLISIGGKPLLETIVENFKDNGFHNFFFSVNYKAEMIEQYFGDGSKWNVNISYLKEYEKLGTAGALSLLPGKMDRPIIVMNGDLLTKVNFKQLLDYHLQHKAMGTMCVREYSFQVPYGVVLLDDGKLLSIEEKPVQTFFVSAGVYVLEPEAINYIPQQQYFDMPSLFDIITKNECIANVFPIREYWIDIGKCDDLDRANSDYRQVFGV
jgi:dTDP-glucose pyrophosphorylase/predicted transcriptional regulator